MNTTQKMKKVASAGILLGVFFALASLVSAQGPGYCGLGFIDGPHCGGGPVIDINFAPATVDLGISPSTISSGGSATITWSSTNAGLGCYGTGFSTGFDGFWNELNGMGASPSQSQINDFTARQTSSQNGSRTVSANSTQSYSITCESIGGTANDTVTLTVGGAPVAGPSATISASPTSINAGQSSTVSWSSSSATSCTSNEFTTSGATSGTRTVAPVSDTTYSISCVGAGGSVVDSVLVRVNQPGPTGFQNVFQIDNDADHSIIFDTISAPINAGLGANQTAIITAPFTFPTIGTWYVRACADRDSATFSGTIAESDEANNCSPDWTAVLVTSSTITQCSDGIDNNGANGIDYPNDPSCDSPTDATEDGQITESLSCSVSNNNPIVGTAVTYSATPNGVTAPYTWSPSSAVSCTASSGTTQSCTFTAPGVYANQVKGTGSSYTAYCPQVIAGCAGSPSVEISSNKDRVVVGEDTFTINYSASGINDASCTLTGGGLNVSYPVNSCNVSPNSISVGPIQTRTQYTFACGAVSKTIDVLVVPKIKEI